MADYVRFEVYLPVHFTATEIDRDSGQEKDVQHALPIVSVNRFILECTRQFNGITEFYPSPAFRGRWRDDRGKPITVDYLTYFFVLVRIFDEQRAHAFFARWKGILARNLNQKVILIVYDAVHTIGDFF